ncbi:hypothetical protein Droror1_Dr00019511 [Drosera rotundifolia]
MLVLESGVRWLFDFVGEQGVRESGFHHRSRVSMMIDFALTTLNKESENLGFRSRENRLASVLRLADLLVLGDSPSNWKDLWGAESKICVYYGTGQGSVRDSKKLKPERIRFNGTVGFQWLTESLGLDRSLSVRFNGC